MQSIIEKLTNNIVVAAFVPSVIFCTLGILIFEPQMQSVIIRNIIDIYKELGLFVIFLAFTISLFLVYLRELIFEVYKGVYFPKFFNYFEKKRAEKRMEKIQTLRQDIGKEKETSETLPMMENELYSLVANYQSDFPSDERIVASRLGNILRAAENHIATRYTLDSATLWANLMQVLPQSSYQQIENSFNKVSLLINSSVLSLIMFTLSLTSTIMIYINQSAWQKEYIITAVVSLVLSYAFYIASLPIAKYYAQMYCSAFHLHRFEILRKMNLELPKDSDDEYVTWTKVSEFLAVGNEFGELFFEYSHSRDKTNNKEGNQEGG